MNAAPVVDLGAIEEQLKKARVASGSATATTMNFVVYVDDESLQERASDKALALADKYPARIMLLHTDDEGAKVSIKSRKAGDGTMINAECIELGIRHMSPQAICSAINTLRVADIPNVLWWTSETVASEMLFDEMIVMMDTVIVDSSGAAPGDLAIRELTEFFNTGTATLIRDLAYMRLAPWQDMVAQFFDDKDFLNALNRIERVQITSGSCAEAYYLVGWLASRLGWKPCGRYELCYSDGRPIKIELKKDGELRRVLRVALSTSQTTFCAELTDSPDTVCLEISGGETAPQRCSPLQHIDNMSLIEKAFLVPAHDEVFEASLRVLNDLLAFKA